MEQSTTINKVVTELEKDFFLASEFKDRLEYYLALTYGCGFDSGRSTVVHAKPVARVINSKLETFPSASAAERALQLPRSGVSKAIRKNGKCKGFKWYYL